MSGLTMWCSPSRRHWYSPPQSRSGSPTGRSGKASRVPPTRLLGQHVEADARDAGGGAREVPVDQLPIETDGLEDLGPAVALQGGDPHLGHHLQDALVEGLDVVPDRLCMVDPGQDALADHDVEGLERHPGIDGPGPVADEQAHVVDFPGVAGLDDQAAARAACPRARGDGAPPPWPGGSEWPRGRGRCRDRRGSGCCSPRRWLRLAPCCRSASARSRAAAPAAAW